MTNTSNTTQRDQLARDIFLADNFNGPVEVLAGDWATLVQEEADSNYAHRIADGLIAKGYTQPRTITTVEELDALPDGSVILDGAGDAGQKLSGMWHFPETAPMGSSKVAKYGVATVLRTPEATR